MDQEFTSGAGTSDIATALQIANQNMSQLIQAIGQLNTTLQTVLPNVQSNATSASGGSRSLPSNPVGFLVMNNPVTGSSVRVPYYNP